MSDLLTKVREYNEHSTEILEERGRLYQDPCEGNVNLGRVWAGILTQHFGFEVPDIPPHVVCSMFAANKILRAVLPTSAKPDDFEDGVNYLNMARYIKEERTDGKG